MPQGGDDLDNHVGHAESHISGWEKNTKKTFVKQISSQIRNDINTNILNTSHDILYKDEMNATCQKKESLSLMLKR